MLKYRYKKILFSSVFSLFLGTSPPAFCQNLRTMDDLDSIAQSQGIMAEAQQQKVQQAQNAADYREIYSACRKAYQLCKPPYETVFGCNLFQNSDCDQAGIRQKVVADYFSHGGLWHQKDCEFKLAACQGAGPDACRPYWSYCGDYDQKARSNKNWTGLPLPPVPSNLSSLRPKMTYTPCNVPGYYLLFDKEAMPIISSQIAENGVLKVRSNPDSSQWYRVGVIDASGNTTPDKHLKHKDRKNLQKAAMLGRLIKGQYIMRCGVHNPPAVLAFYEEKTNAIATDQAEGDPGSLMTMDIH